MAQDRLNGEMKGGSDIESGNHTSRHEFELVRIEQSPVVTVQRYGWRNIPISLIDPGSRQSQSTKVGLGRALED